MTLIDSLHILEFASGTQQLSSNFQSIFEIRTCQRTLLISFEPHSNSFAPRRAYQGALAYEFLLRFTCGLESEIKGETDVFGQTKTALKEFVNDYKTDAQFANDLNRLFLKVFEDTKEIRANYLQGIGGSTYGALARRILNPTPTDRVLVIGAGQMSKSVAPYFSDFKLKIWNRSAERLFTLKSELEQKSIAHIQAFTGETELKNALQDATLIVIATPADASPQSVPDSLVLKHCTTEQKILHLGGQKHEIAHFSASKNINQKSFWSLSDLFLLEKEQSVIREKQVQQAVAACHQRALLRSLARSIHISHGWEDLALFN